MPLFHYTIGGKTLAIRLPEQGGRISDVRLDGEALVPTEEEMQRYAAVIALALLTHEVETVHDEETGVITLASTNPATPSAWANPANALQERGTL